MLLFKKDFRQNFPPGILDEMVSHEVCPCNKNLYYNYTKNVE